MSALDSMLSQYRSNAPSPVASMPNAMPTTKAPSVAAPNSFFAGVPSTPESITAGGVSRGMSPFGMQNIPDLSSATPQQRQFLIDSLSNLTYSVPLGGYLYRETANDPNSAYVRGYYGQPMTGGQSGANALAQRAYNLIGSFPTRSQGTLALNQLTGGMPATGAPLNTRSPGGNYGGPFTFPGWNFGQPLI